MDSRKIAQLVERGFWGPRRAEHSAVYGAKVERKNSLVLITLPDGEQFEVRVTKVKKAKEGD